MLGGRRLRDDVGKLLRRQRFAGEVPAGEKLCEEARQIGGDGEGRMGGEDDAEERPLRASLEGLEGNIRGDKRQDILVILGIDPGLIMRTLPDVIGGMVGARGEGLQGQTLDELLKRRGTRLGGIEEVADEERERQDGVGGRLVVMPAGERSEIVRSFASSAAGSAPGSSG